MYETTNEVLMILKFIKDVMAFHNRKSSFLSAIERENSELVNIANQNIIVQDEQVWRRKLDLSDQYCDPVFLHVSSVEGSLITYTSNILKGSFQMEIQNLKQGFVLVSD